MKKLVIGLASASLAITSLGLLTPNAEAACNTTAQDKPTSGSTSIYKAPNNTEAYYSGLSGTQGYAGVKGDTGYLEGNGGTNGGHIRGKTNNGAANGRVEGSSSGARVCVNDTNVKTP